MSGPDILSAEFAANPYPFYRQMRDETPLYFHEPTQSYILSRYDDVAEAFTNPVFTSRNYRWQLEPVHGYTILQMEGREHSLHRNIVSPAFRGRELAERFRPVIDRNARELIDAFRGADEVDLVAAFTSRFPINVIVDMLALPKSDQSLFQRWYHSIMEFLSNLAQDPDVAAAGLRTKEELQAYVLPIVEERRRQPGDDLLSRLCTARIEGEGMSDLEIKAFVSLLLVAGGETTDKAVASLMKNLIEHPDQLKQVREQRELIDCAAAETLRYSPPVHMIMREPAEDVKMSGGVIPAGATVTCLIGSANRDERVFREPDRFDLHRDDLDMQRAWSGAANHVAFALGRHFCVGANLARTEIEIGVGQLLDAMEDIEFASGAPPPEVGIFTRAPQELRIRFRPTAAGRA